MVGIDKLKKIQFLKNLPDGILEKIGTIAVMETFDEESILVRQDQKLYLVYMLVSGKIFLNCRATSGKALTLDELSPGQTFGVSALLGDSPATFTAICAEECEILTLSADQMVQLFEQDYQLGYTMMQEVVLLFKSNMNKHTRQFLHSLATHPAMAK
ncbi:MAG: cyclic nucleotide-binding domain-containing protein [Desulfobacteraceae bacterium]|nr:cyclic nucleotide-binding domain-containing protein [Desulfobacteraceae bacterium]